MVDELCPVAITIPYHIDVGSGGDAGIAPGRGDSVAQKPYFRDVWALGPSNSGYPGAFPRGLITRIGRRWWGQKRLWLFSGSHKDSGGTTVDINPDMKPDYVCNCESLPFPDSSFDFVMADPPYSEEESMRLCGLPYVNIIKTPNEMIRVCEPGGHIIFFHRLVPAVFPGLKLSERTQLVAVVGVFTIAGLSNMRALTVFRKYQTLEAFQTKEKL